MNMELLSCGVEISRINPLKFQGCESINGKKRAIVEFEVFNPGIKRGEIRMIDMLGNIASREFSIIEKTSQGK